jgi:hypothetical protein
MTGTNISDELWDRFHQLVNMTSPELADWLRVQSADEETEELPDHAGRRLGQRVLGILGKRRVDLTDEDVDAMTKVVDVVESQRGVDLEPTAGDDHWRRSLMAIGHDPLKPV